MAFERQSHPLLMHSSFDFDDSSARMVKVIKGGDA